MKKIPMYQIIENELKEKIDKGEYLPGQLIESENILKDKYHVTRMTVRQALGNLTFEGYLYKKKGKGTFVMKKSTHESQNIVSELWKIDDIGYKKNVTKSTLKAQDKGSLKDTSILNIEYTVNDDQEYVALGHISIKIPSSYPIDSLNLITGYTKVVSNLFVDQKVSKRYTFKLIQMTDDLFSFFNIKQYTHCICLIETIYSIENQKLSEKSLMMNPKLFRIDTE